MKVTPGKRKGLEAVSDSRGVIAAAAMDQRGSLESAIAKEKGIDKKDVTGEDVEEFKEAVRARSHAARQRHSARSGVRPARREGAREERRACCSPTKIAATTTRRPGRLPDLLDIWSVRRLVAAGADCIKILLYYTPFDPPDINEIKHAWVERIGAECVAADVPFFLEFVGYEEGGDEKGMEFARKKPEVVTQQHGGIFSKPQYGVDVLKVEVPVNMAFVQGTRSARASPPTRATKPRNISARPRRPRRSRSSIFRPA